MVTVFLGMGLFLCTFMFVPAGATGSEESVCPSVVYLKDGIGGQIPCLCGSFTIVAWYNEEEFNNGGSPIINYDKVQRRGRGFSSGEYDIAENGSLIIRNVTRSHDGVFVVTVADDSQHREDKITIRVIVVDPAVPAYPVVENKVNQKHVYMEVSRNGALTCAMYGVYPAVNLTFTSSQRDKIIFQHDSMSRTLQENNLSYDVTLRTSYTVKDPTIKRLTVFCEVAGDDVAKQFPDKTTVFLLLESAYPKVNGYEQSHVYLDVTREGQLNCVKKHTDITTNLTWEVADTSLEDKILIDSIRSVSNNNDGTWTIKQTINYMVDYSVERILLLCKVIASNTDENLFTTKVDLLFENVYPVVNGHFRQNHVYLDVNRNGHLTCVKESVDVGTRLFWKILDQNVDNKITSQSDEFKSTNEDGTINVNQTFDYAIHDRSMERVTLECRVLKPATDEHVVATRVDLLFQSVYPVVNGLINQRHVYLDANREGHLVCIKENVAAGTTLAWKIDDPNMQEKITFQSNAIVLDNNDGTVTINQTSAYEILDHSLERITIECEVTAPDSDESSLATKVDLLFQNVYPIVNGHVAQNHVYLDVDRMGHLTCMKENVKAGATLNWVLHPNLHGKISYQSHTFTSINKDDSVSINQIFEYKILDTSLERITLNCSLIEADSFEHPFTTMVELLFTSVLPSFPTDAVISGCYHQKHSCVLQVQRSGELTCTVKNSHYPVDLTWKTFYREETHLEFAKPRVAYHNSSNLYDVSITTPYTVVDTPMTSVTVQCDAYRSDSRQVMATAKASLVIQTDGYTNNYDTLLVLSWLTVVLVIALGVLVFILWYCNRKSYKNAIGKNIFYSDTGCPDMCELGNRGLNIQQETQPEQPSDSPDSGNSGSASSGRSESEISEKSLGMSSEVMMFKTSSKQAHIANSKEINEEVPMLQQEV